MRVLLKISGEVLAGDKGKGFDSKMLKQILGIIKKLLNNNIELGITIGGGNLIRGEEMEDFSLYNAHNMGLLCSSINAYGLEDYFNKNGVKALSLHSTNIDGIFEKFSKKRALDILKKGEVLVFGGGTGLPYFTTDTGAVLRAIEIEADLLIKATKVNGIYTKDPKKYNDAVLIEEVTYNEVLEKELKVMDLTAIALARDNGLAMKVVSLYEEDSILKAIKGEKIGTSIIM